MISTERSSYHWTEDQTITLLKTMRNFQLLWIVEIFSKEQYQTAIKSAQLRLIRLNECDGEQRPWNSIRVKLNELRSKYNNNSSWKYLNEMKLSLEITPGAKEVRKRNDVSKNTTTCYQ